MRDIYVYEGTDVLINKLGIRDFEQLKEAEANYCGNALAELVDRPEKGNFDEIHLQRIHYRIFCDIYEWAGEFRKINIEKPENALSGLSVEYSDIFEIRKDLKRILKRMKQENWGVSHQKNVELLSFYLAEVWRVHPFRDDGVIIRTSQLRQAKSRLALICPNFLSQMGHEVGRRRKISYLRTEVGWECAAA